MRVSSKPTEIRSEQTAHIDPAQSIRSVDTFEYTQDTRAIYLTQKHLLLLQNELEKINFFTPDKKAKRALLDEKIKKVPMLVLAVTKIAHAINAAKERTKAIALGETVRRNILPVREILRVLEPALAKAMAREIVEKFSNADAFKGHGKRIYMKQEQYKFFNLDTGKTEIFKSPYDFWVKETENGIEFELIEKTLGTGTSWTALKTRKVEISLQSTEHALSQKDDVLLRTQFKDIAEDIQQTIQLLKDSGFTDAKIQSLGYDLRSKLDRKTGDFIEATGSQLFKSNYYESFQSMTRKEQLTAIGSVAVSLNALHEAGLAHRDIKSENISIDYQNRAHLADFDTLAKFGRIKNLGDLKGSPTHVDALGWLGRITPFQDIYALSITAYETTTNMSIRESAKQVILTNYQIFQSIQEQIPGFYKKLAVQGLNSILEELSITAPSAQRDRTDYNKISIEDFHKKFPVYKKFMTDMMAST